MIAVYVEQIQEILYISNKPGTIYFEWGCPHQRGQICLFRPEAILKIFLEGKNGVHLFLLVLICN